MLQNWLHPVQKLLIEQASHTTDGYIGSCIKLHTKEALPDLPKGSIAIIGMHDKTADAIRNELYLLTCPFNQLNIIDLGNLRKKTDAFAIPLLRELLQANVLPILIGKEAQHLRSLFQAELQLRRALKLTLIDERLALFNKDPRTGKKGYLEDIAHLPPDKLFHLCLIGLQAQLVTPAQFHWLNKQNFDFLRLGQLRDSILKAEPMLRDADLLGFHLSSLKMSEAPAVKCATPNGLQAEEACHLARFAGMSDKLTAMAIYGLHLPLDRNNQTTQIAAQIIWYFIEGLSRRVKDYPFSTQQMTEYVIPLPQQNLELSFWKSEKSGRWWFQPLQHPSKSENRHRLIPCTYQDYLNAASGELPDIILKHI